MRIGILGTRGIPNHYGGFEQFAEYLSQGLHKRGCQVFVYNSHNHPYKEKNWKGVNIIHQYNPEKYIGLAGQFIYDFNCILDSRKRKFDILLQLGYTTNSIWWRLLPSEPIKVCNPDGMEWNRSKYPKPVKRFLKYAEKLAVKSNKLLIADSKVIRDYYINKYSKSTIFAAYPAIVFNDADASILQKYNLKENQYCMIIARLQPDNNVETVLSGYTQSNTKMPLLIIGNSDTKYGRYLKQKYLNGHVRFLGSIYDHEVLNNLRYYSFLYFHGHSAGGTNPSLLEAMASSALICAHDNPFNKSVLGKNALFFENEFDIINIVNNIFSKKDYNSFVDLNRRKITLEYSLDSIINIYYNAFTELFAKKICKGDAKRE